jgi:dsDNA-specific endonuclease/ATPase MutS2
MKEYAGKHGRHLIFIHGKGEGVLRKAILDELNRRHRNECLWQDASFKEYGYGATEVVIK